MLRLNTTYIGEIVLAVCYYWDVTFSTKEGSEVVG